ncbi:MAG: SHOCT domain-containing protein [Firmicutes bacterium]|nr:SHOCT domain-containing protein [Bacillota bacterium]
MNKKTFNLLGVITGALSIVFGIVVIVLSRFHGNTYYSDATITFGADYYTESYQAMAKTVNAVSSNTEALNHLLTVTGLGIGFLLIIIGLIAICKFGKSMADAPVVLEAKPEPEPQPEPEPEPQPEPERLTDGKIRKLQVLKKLYNDGRISQETFDAKKKEILGL